MPIVWRALGFVAQPVSPGLLGLASPGTCGQAGPGFVDLGAAASRHALRDCRNAHSARPAATATAIGQPRKSAEPAGEVTSSFDHGACAASGRSRRTDRRIGGVGSCAGSPGRRAQIDRFGGARCPLRRTADPAEGRWSAFAAELGLLVLVCLVVGFIPPRGHRSFWSGRSTS